ncbi:MAG: hypothetical protein KFW09_03440 [Oscillospiraceae bacterium]|nr:hypothetical protein [Oscillospiraceae bacterium]
MENNSKYDSVKNKLENFFYHYKWIVMILIIVISIIIILIINFFNRPSYDLTVLIVGDYSFLSEYDRIDQVLKEYADDYNNDGEILIELVPFTIQDEENSKNPYPNALNLSKLMANLTLSTTVIYIIDDYVYDSIGTENAFINLELEYGDIYGVKGDKFNIENTEFLERLNLQNFPKDFSILIRNIEDFSDKNKEKVILNYNNSKKFVNNIITNTHK